MESTDKQYKLANKKIRKTVLGLINNPDMKCGDIHDVLTNVLMQYVVDIYLHPMMETKKPVDQYELVSFILKSISNKTLLVINDRLNTEYSIMPVTDSEVMKSQEILH